MCSLNVSIFLCWISCVLALQSSNCAKWACDTSNSFTVSNSLSSTSSPIHKWSFSTTDALGIGCVAGSDSQVTCIMGQKDGLIAISSSTGQPLWKFQGAGSGADCNSYFPNSFGEVNLPIADLTGDVVVWDGDNVAFVQSVDGSARWFQAMLPPSCGSRLSSVSLTNHSDLTFTIHNLAEVFAYVATGIPQSLIVFNGNDDGTKVFPPPPMLKAESGVCTNSDQQTTPQGKFIPISQQVVDGARILTLSRFQSDASTFIDSSSSSSPSPDIYLLAVDQHNAAECRLRWVWQLQLPLNDTAMMQCLQTRDHSDNHDTDGGSGVTIMGPALTSPGVVFVMLSCNPASASETSSTHVAFSIQVDDSPSILWRSVWSGAQFSLTNQTAVPMAWSLNPLFPSSSPQVFMLFADLPDLFVIDAPSGGIDSVLSLTQALVSMSNSEQCDMASAMKLSGVEFVSNGPILMTPNQNSNHSSSFIALIPGKISSNLNLPLPQFWISAFEVAVSSSASSSFTLRALWCVPSPSTLPGISSAPVFGQLNLVNLGDKSHMLIVPTPFGIHGFELS